MLFIGVVIVVAISFGLFLLSALTGKKIFGYALIGLWAGIILLYILAFIFKPFYTKKILDKSDFYGEYVIDRDFFPGKQADWQYNHFRFEIKKSNIIYFHVTDKENIIETHEGIVTYPSPYNSARIAIEMNQPTHHILSSNPTIYREIWDYFLVFNSPKFHNMYFRKAKWKPIE